MKRILKKAAKLNLLLIPCFLILGLHFVLSRVSAQTPDQNRGVQTDEPLRPLPAASDLPGDAPAPALSPAPVRAARWYRSNAGGMALQETDTRFAALSSEYALLVDYADPKNMPEMLRPYYRNQYYIETHVLYHRGEESRRQWIFRDERGTARLVSVLNQARPAAEPAPPPPAEASGGDEEEDAESLEIPPSSTPTGRSPWGFIEVYNENYRIIEEHMFSDDGTETVIEYAYRGGLLIKAEANRKETREGEELVINTFTDDYRYNRSASLRLVERLYHEEAEALPIRLEFPNRVLDLAAEGDFISEKLAWNSEFFGEFETQPGYRIVYTTDERGRILTQTLLDDKDSEVWVIQNTWSGNRIASARKTEGEDVLFVEYEYNGKGERILERNTHNGVLERLVRAEDGHDVEELYMHGEVILRAIWEEGRKISEKRIRRRPSG